MQIFLNLYSSHKLDNDLAFMSTAFQPITHTLLYHGTSPHLLHSDGCKSHHKLWHVTRQKDSHKLTKNTELYTKCRTTYFVPISYIMWLNNFKICSSSWQWLSCAAQCHFPIYAGMKAVSKYVIKGCFTFKPYGVLCGHEECYWNAGTSTCILAPGGLLLKAVHTDCWSSLNCKDQFWN
jgi:hypothetical protein